LAAADRVSEDLVCALDAFEEVVVVDFAGRGLFVGVVP
jgi:hypothetical protein